MATIHKLLTAAAMIAGMSILSLSTAPADGKPATVEPETYKLLERVDRLLDESAYSEALNDLNKMNSQLAEGSLDKAVILRSIASVYARQGNYREAAQALEKCLATNLLPKDQAELARWNLGEIYVVLNQFSKAASLLESGLKQVNPSAQHYFLLANVYARLKQYEKSAAFLREAIAGKMDAAESWYKTLLAMYYEAQNYQESAKVLKQLIEKFPPNKQYWLQLTAMYQQMNQYNQALAVNELAYREGLIGSAEEILNLASLMSYLNAPYRAAELLEKELASGRLANNSANWEKAANAWSQAREFDRAVSALKKASKSHPTGELDFRAGQIHVEQRKWKDAQAELSEAIRKGGLKNPGSAHLLYGISCYELHFHEQARDSFLKAQQYSGTRDPGRQWVNYIDSEG